MTPHPPLDDHDESDWVDIVDKRIYLDGWRDGAAWTIFTITLVLALILLGCNWDLIQAYLSRPTS